MSVLLEYLKETRVLRVLCYTGVKETDIQEGERGKDYHEVGMTGGTTRTPCGPSKVGVL